MTRTTTTGRNEASSLQAKRAILLLTLTVAMLMTGVGIIFPIFARRLNELGGGMRTLGLMTVSFMLAQLVFAPIMGSLADRFGRKPIILLSLATFALANIGFLFAAANATIIIIRALQGAFSAGLFPSAMGMVGDLMPISKRARWVGIISASYTAGFIFGPLLGGFLYDSWGYSAPFMISAVLGFVAFCAAIIFVPETRAGKTKLPIFHRTQLSFRGRNWSWLPRPLTMLGTLLSIDFVVVFAFAFVEPQMIFSMYDDLGWTTIQFGILVGAYGLTGALGQAAAGPISDRISRFPLIITGIILNALFYAGLIRFTNFYLLIITAVIAGLGEALLMPALGAYYLDIASPQHRSRLMGLKESAAATGGVLGPLLIVTLSGMLSASQVYWLALILTTLSAVSALLFLRPPLIIPDTATTKAAGNPIGSAATIGNEKL